LALKAWREKVLGEPGELVVVGGEVVRELSFVACNVVSVQTLRILLAVAEVCVVEEGSGDISAEWLLVASDSPLWCAVLSEKPGSQEISFVGLLSVSEASPTFFPSFSGSICK